MERLIDLNVIKTDGWANLPEPPSSPENILFFVRIQMITLCNDRNKTLCPELQTCLPYSGSLQNSVDPEPSKSCSHITSHSQHSPCPQTELLCHGPGIPASVKFQESTVESWAHASCRLDSLLLTSFRESRCGDKSPP